MYPTLYQHMQFERLGLSTGRFQIYDHTYNLFKSTKYSKLLWFINLSLVSLLSSQFSLTKCIVMNILRRAYFAEVDSAECSLVVWFIKFQFLPFLKAQFSQVNDDCEADVASAEYSFIMCFIKFQFLPLLKPQFSQVDDDREGDPAQHLLFPNCAQAKPSSLKTPNTLHFTHYFELYTFASRQKLLDTQHFVLS